jgi:hypothetical protein
MTRNLAFVLALLGCSSPGRSTPLANSAATPTDYRIEQTESGKRVRDLAPPLAFSYFDIGVNADGTAWLLPRPDFAIMQACELPTALTPIATRHGLCSVPAQEREFVERINALSIEDAVALKRTFERTLVFCPGKAEGPEGFILGVLPDPRDRDIQALCALPRRSGLSSRLCAYHAPDNTSLGTQFFDNADYRTLAAGLNQRYGISPAVAAGRCP